MYRKEVNLQSPLRILEASMHGGLGKGNLGVVMARAGVGKTACLIQIALDDLMRNRSVLHIALGHQTIDHVHSWYDALFDDMAQLTQLQDRSAVASEVANHRIIHAVPENRLKDDELQKILSLYHDHLQFEPDAVIVDGYDWDGSASEIGENLNALKAIATRIDAELWFSARSHRATTGSKLTEITKPCSDHVGLLDVVIALEPEEDHVSIRMLKDHDAETPNDTVLQLQCDTMRLVAPNGSPLTSRLAPSACTLLSGGAKGAEAAFGALAEQWGMAEINYSFDGHAPARTRGVIRLSDADLARGAVVPSYIQSHMHRTYPQTLTFRRLLQSIWHQVNTARQVFVVGIVNEDNTVKGGTGWAAELAKHLHKDLFVYEQERRQWLTWKDDAWTPVSDPRITAARFTGCGTQTLSDDGQAALSALFERSFAPNA